MPSSLGSGDAAEKHKSQSYSWTSSRSPKQRFPKWGAVRTRTGWQRIVPWLCIFDSISTNLKIGDICVKFPKLFKTEARNTKIAVFCDPMSFSAPIATIGASNWSICVGKQSSKKRWHIAVFTTVGDDWTWASHLHLRKLDGKLLGERLHGRILDACGRYM